MSSLVETGLSSSPYPGLRPFRREETDIFFGRDEQVDELLQKLQHGRFLAVVGASGSGKSSLVHAGLISALEAGLMADAGARWCAAVMRPGERPMSNLTKALLNSKILEQMWPDTDQSAAMLKSTLRRGPLGLVELLMEPNAAKLTNLLLIVDQFEEIFRFRRHGGSSRAAESLIALPQIAPASLDANLIRIMFRVLGIVAAVIIFLEGGRYLGFPLTTLIASAGIGGLAIALSAQGLIGGLFGTVTVLLDKPYRVGERIVVKGHDGFVEEIGLRSTKIRALDDHVISIPNDQIADAEIENIGKRKHIRRLSELHIPLDTPRCKVEAALQCIRDVLKNHEGMDPKFPPRIYFSDITPEAFTIKLIYWYTPPDQWAFMAFGEKVNLELFAAFEKQGIQFSLPLRHTYWKTDEQQGPLDIMLKQQPEHANPKIAPRSD